MAVDTNVLCTQAQRTALVATLGEMPQVKLSPEAEGKMKALSYNCLLSSSGPGVRELFLPCLAGKT